MQVTYQDAIALAVWNRPPVNAIDLDFVTDLDATLQELERSDAVRGVVLTGEGSCFSAGLDLKVLPSYRPAQRAQLVEKLNRLVVRLYGFAKPTVTAVNGHAIAGGLIVALACDYRVGPNHPCKIGLPEARVGIPFPVAPLEVVRAELGPAARLLMLRAHNAGPREALESGALDELAASDEVSSRAVEVARELAASPPDVYEAIKKGLRLPALERINSVLSAGADPVLVSFARRPTFP